MLLPETNASKEQDPLLSVNTSKNNNCKIAEGLV